MGLNGNRPNPEPLANAAEPLENLHKLQDPDTNRAQEQIMTGNRIVTTPKAEMRALAFKGIVAFSSFSQIRDMLLRKFGEETVLLFARPVENTRDGQIDWYTPIQGEARQLTSLAEDQQTPILDYLRKKALDIENYAEELIRTGDPLKVTRGHILKLALLYPSESDIYVIDKQPILTCWGFAPGSTGVEARNLAKIAFIKPAQSAGTAPEEAPFRETEPPLQAEPEPVKTGEEPQKRKESRARYSGWWWFVPLLPLLLLLALIFFSFGPFPALAGKSLWHVPWPEKANTDSLKGKIPELEKQISELQLALDKHLAMCKTQEEPVAQAPEAEKLVIPDNAEDTSFMQGRWLCQTGLVNSRTEEPVQMAFEFGSNGRGEATIVQRSGPCRGPAVAAIANGRLHIEIDEVVCTPPGANYARMSIYCENSSGKATVCKGENENGTSWDAVFHKMR